MTDDTPTTPPASLHPSTVDPETGREVLSGPPVTQVPMDMTPVGQQFALMQGEATDETGTTVKVAFVRIQTPMVTALLMLGEAAGLKLRDDLDALFGTGLAVVRDLPAGMILPGPNGHRHQ